MKQSIHFSRRFLLKAGTVGTLALASGGFRFMAYAESSSDQDNLTDFSGWVEIRPDNTVEILFPATDMGQGTHTGLPQILADELDADWQQVVIKQLNIDDRKFGNPSFGHVLYTAGSSSIHAYFDILRHAGAHLRALIVHRVAQEWQVSPNELVSKDNQVLHAASGKQMSYGDAVQLTGFLETPLPDPVKLKSCQDYNLIGKSIPRRDIPDKTTGKAQYAIDVRLPNMLYASVERSPVEGEKIISLDSEAAKASNGVVAVITLPDAVAVVARTIHASQVGRSKLNITWSNTSPFRQYSSEQTLVEYAKVAASEQPGDVWREVGNVSTALASATETIDALYTSDYAYHAQIEPIAAVAKVDEDGKGAEIWAGTQTQSWTTRTATEVLGTSQDRIKLNMMKMGGGFGRRTELMQNYVRDAILCSKATQKPVKVIWTRPDDIKFGAFRPAAAQHIKASITAEGTLTAFHHRVATPSVIEYFNPIRWQQVAPKDVISMRGAENKFYHFYNFRAEHVKTQRHARISPWRGIGAAYTNFASEAFLDEVAHKANIAPYAYRKSLLARNPRGTALLEKVASMADAIPIQEGSARGLAFAGYHNTQSAAIVEISVNQNSGEIKVHKAWVAVDAGQIVSPDNALNQIEGGIIWGVSAALHEHVRIVGGEVQQSNFYDYPILRHNEVPKTEVYLAQNNETPEQIGEASNPVIAPAIANAFFNLTGKRIRHLPFTRDTVLNALS